MKYNFDEIIDRKKTYSLKWDVGEGELPMWVADMDFRTSPEIVSEMVKRAEHGIFGYTVVSEEWYASIQNWWKKRHNFEIKKEWLIFSTGVIPAISSIIRRLTTVNENIVILTPVYNIFFNSVINNGRRVLESPLRFDGIGYTIDYEHLEQQLADPQTSMLILSNPHNPGGIIWDKDTLERLGDLCWKYGVYVISDEIHCDLTDPGYEYIPFASISDKCRKISATCIAPTKAFNLAGIHTAAVVVPNEKLKDKIERALNTDEVAEPNAFAINATIAAYTEGEEWLDCLREYISNNKEIVYDYIEKEIPELSVVRVKSTYLIWINCHKLGYSGELSEFIREKTGLYLSEGGQYSGNGDWFIRMNVACPKEILMDGLERLKNGCHEYMKRVD